MVTASSSSPSSNPNTISQEINTTLKTKIESLKNNEKQKFSVERAELSEGIEFNAIGDLIKTLFDKSTGSALDETETAITDALAEVSGNDVAVEKWLVEELRGRFGLKLKVENHNFVIEGDETDKLSKEDFTIPQRLLEIEAKLRDKNYSFEEFKEDLSSLKFLKESYAEKFNKLCKTIGISIKGKTFSEKIESVLTHEKLEESFQKVKAIEINKGTDLEKAGIKLGMVLSKEQRDLLNVVPGFDVESVLKSVDGDMEKFQARLFESVYSELQSWYDLQKPKSAQKTENPKMDLSAGKMKETIEETGSSLFGAGELPLVVKHLFSEDQIKSFKESAKNGADFSLIKVMAKNGVDSFLTLDFVKMKVSNTLEGLNEKFIRTGFNDHLKEIDTKEEAEFMVKKMDTVSYGYRDSDWAGKYESYIKETGPAALDFSDWIGTKKISFGEKLGAMFKNLLGPFMEIFADFMGDKKEKESTVASKIIEGYETSKKSFEKKETTEKEQNVKIDAFIQETEWKDINIKGLVKEDDSKKPTVENIRAVLREKFENFDDFKAIVESKNEVMQIARNKKLKFSSLQSLFSLSKNEKLKIKVDTENKNLTFEKKNGGIFDGSEGTIDWGDQDKTPDKQIEDLFEKIEKKYETSSVESDIHTV